jgi:hypothetical protein
VADILQYSDFKDDFASRVGKYNVSILNEIKDLYIYDFGIFLEIAPDEEERAQLEANINMALSKSDINLEDAIDIREIKNIKMANQLLKLKRVRLQDHKDKMVMMQQQMQSQQNMELQKMTSETAMQKIQAESQAKMQVKQADVAFHIEMLKAEAELKKILMSEEFRYKMALAGIDENALNIRDKSKEDGKSNRISQQNSEQSKLINQRKYNLPPINFESNEDTLDGFDLSVFDPR